MKFKKFLIETKISEELDGLSECFLLSEYHIELFKINEGAILKVDKKIMKKSLNYLTKKFGLKKKDFNYIGFTNLDFIKKGSKLLQFNIIKKNHEKFGSTVAYRYED